MKLVASKNSSSCFSPFCGSRGSFFHFTSYSTILSQVCHPTVVPCLTRRTAMQVARKKTVLQSRRFWLLASRLIQMALIAPARCIPYLWDLTLTVTSPTCTATDQMCRCHASMDGCMTDRSSPQQQPVK